MKTKIQKIGTIILLSLLMIFIGVGCGDDGPTGSENNSPSIISINAIPDSLFVLESSTITCTATDPDNDVLIYNWTTTAGTINGTGAVITWDAPDSAGTYSIKCKVSDGKSGIDSLNVNIVVKEIVPCNNGEYSLSGLNINNVLGVELYIDYDTTQVTFDSLTSTYLDAAQTTVNTTNGVISIVWVDMGLQSFSVTDSDAIFTLYFTGLFTTSTITFNSLSEMFDEQGDPIVIRDANNNVVNIENLTGSISCSD